MILCVHFGNDKLHLAPDYERYSCPSAPPWSHRHYQKRFSAGINILIYNTSLRIKSVQSNRGCELALDDFPGADPFGLSEA
jgi:hypothetical protein